MTSHCGRLDPHPSHEWAGRPALLSDNGEAFSWEPTTIRPADRICPGEVVIEGDAECVVCQTAIAVCEHGRAGQLRRWSE